MHRTISKNIWWIFTSFSRKARAKTIIISKKLSCVLCVDKGVWFSTSGQDTDTQIFTFFVFPASHKSSDQKSFETFIFLPVPHTWEQIHCVKHVRRQKPTSPSLPQKRRVSSFLWSFDRNVLSDLELHPTCSLHLLLFLTASQSMRAALRCLLETWMAPKVSLHPALPSNGKMGVSRVTGSDWFAHSLASR